MRELGEGSADFHRRVGRRAAELGFSVVAVGAEARWLAEGAGAAGASVEWYTDADAAARWAAAAIADGRFADGDLVLVKGSRGVGLEAVVRALLAPVATVEGGRG
jgi:UDP-N-acetylmuramyl pentapeptide synthase